MSHAAPRTVDHDDSNSRKLFAFLTKTGILFTHVGATHREAELSEGRDGVNEYLGLLGSPEVFGLVSFR
jgi:hypothetical protein